jgi:Septum formation
MHRFLDRLPAPSQVWLRSVLLAFLFFNVTITPAAALGGTGVSPGRWAASVCEALDEWATEIDDLELDAYPIEEDDPRLERNHLRVLFEAEIEETDHLLDKLERAGAPNVDSGKKISRDLRQAFRDVRAAMRALRREATRIVGSDNQSFLDNRAALARNVADAGIDLYKDLGQVASRFPPQLTQATSDEEDCAPIEDWALFFGEVAVDLTEGDCFSRAPGGPELSPGKAFVVVVPCATPHTSEAYADIDLSGGAPDAEYPGEEAVNARAGEECRQRFNGYVGRDYDSSSFEIVYLYPTAEDWELGDSFLVCALLSPTEISRSAMGSGL